MKVTVLIAFYNSENLILETLQSILDQSYSNYEIVLVNDDSKDRTIDIVNSFLKGRCKYKILDNQYNKGIPGTLNTGIEGSSSEYIALIDHDDIALASRLEKQVSFLDKNQDIGVCGSFMQEFGHSNSTWRYPANHEAIKPLILIQSPLANPTAMFRKELIETNGIKFNDEYQYSQDYAFWLELIDKTKFSIIEEVLVMYRIHDKNASRIMKVEQYSSWRKAFIDILLPKFDIELSEEELEILYDMKYPNFAERIQNQKDVYINLVDKLVLKNDETHYFNSVELKKLLNNKA
jgi:glycosyltransferase involved in cell wall biosynthesis